MSDTNFLDAINKRIDDYLFMKKTLKKKMVISLGEAVEGLCREKNDEYNLRDKIKEILDYHDIFDFGHNAIELLQQLKAICIAPKGEGD